jgi:hypothetical protein
MPLPKAEINTPIAIEDFSIILSDFIPGIDPITNPAHQEARFDINVRYSNNEIRHIRGNLLPHLDGSPITPQQLSEWGDWLRSKAEDEILP